MRQMVFLVLSHTFTHFLLLYIYVTNGESEAQRGCAELAFEPRPPGSSPRPLLPGQRLVLPEASSEAAGLSDGPPLTPAGPTLAVRGAEETGSGGHTGLARGAGPLGEQPGPGGSRGSSQVIPLL